MHPRPASQVRASPSPPPKSRRLRPNWTRCHGAGMHRLPATRVAPPARFLGIPSAPPAMSHEHCTLGQSAAPTSPPSSPLACAAVAGAGAGWAGARAPHRVEPALAEISRAPLRPVRRSQAPREQQPLHAPRALPLCDHPWGSSSRTSRRARRARRPPGRRTTRRASPSAFASRPASPAASPCRPRASCQCRAPLPSCLEHLLTLLQ